MLLLDRSRKQPHPSRYGIDSASLAEGLRLEL